MVDPNLKKFTPPPVPGSTSADDGSKKPASGCGMGCLVLVGIIIVGIVVSVIALGARVGASNNSDNKYEAIAQCEERVKKLLKAPSTAEFDTDATASSGEWAVLGTVDSENGFGAMLRSEFKCTVTISGDSATTTVDYLR